ncbi:hypothetical protein HPB49_007895 [Dermacentor silvarum]|uniref:Uncharacterized protein n=1 Tax=Dermacentor silvarum TaxID=543639 RepID=A0ACB8DXC0_DERSI|nr:hypothetical protein HPB49_007895 [Dermacentor silvarum]
MRLASAIYQAANVPAQEAGEDTVCSNNRQNIIVVSTPHGTHAAKYRQLEAITIGDRRHEAEEAAKATSSAGKSRSRSRTRSRGRSRSRSRTPDSRKQRRLRSRNPQKDRNERHRDHREGELGRCGHRKTSTNHEGWRQNTR